MQRYFRTIRLGAGERWFWFVALSTLIAHVGGVEFIDYRLSGWVWVISFCGSLLCLTLGKSQFMPFPIIGFVPFICYIILRSNGYARDDLQRIGLFVTPIAIACGISCLKVINLQTVIRAYRFVLLGSIVLYLCAALYQGTAQPGDWYIIAGSGMTFVLVSAAAIVGIARHFWINYLALIAVWLLAFISFSRMPVLVIPALLVLGRPRWSVCKRLISALFILAIAVVAFLPSQPVQRMFFPRGPGNMSDVIRMDRAVIGSAGRLNAWPQYVDAILDGDLLFGAGGISSVDFGNSTFGGWSHPHNEYIRLVFDYGLIGALLYLAPMFYLTYFCYRRQHIGHPELKRIWRISWIGLIGLLLLAITGNAFVYCVFIGNMLFATIGIGFAASHSKTYREHSQKATSLHKHNIGYKRAANSIASSDGR